VQDDWQTRLALMQYDVLHNGPEDEFEQIVSLAQMTFSTPMAAITFLDGRRHRIKSQRGLMKEQASPDAVFAAETLRSDGALGIEDALHDPRFRDHPKVAGPPGFRAYLGAPLVAPEGTRIGSIYVVDTFVRDFSALDGEIIERLAKITMASLELRLISSKDAATGAESRRGFVDVVGRELERHRRRGTRSALLVCRIEGLPGLGAVEGMEAIDATVRHVAERIRVSIRRTDTLGRVGPATFALLLADAGLAEAETAAARIRDAVAAVERDGVAASLGYAAASAYYASGVDWVAAADRAARSGAMASGKSNSPEVTHLGVGERWMN
jgi:diguanylate cyclase (GGDEF)-like protein